MPWWVYNLETRTVRMAGWNKREEPTGLKRGEQAVFNAIGNADALLAHMDQQEMLKKEMAQTLLNPPVIPRPELPKKSAHPQPHHVVRGGR